MRRSSKPSKPFTRGGITYPSQQAYRQALAARAGFASRGERQQTIKAVRAQIEQYLGSLTPQQRGALAGMIADNLGRAGKFVQGAPMAQRGSNRLPRELTAMLRSMGNDQYPLWRLLYQ